MPTLVPSPTHIEAAGNLPKIIEEYVGRVTTGHRDVSVARMQSPAAGSSRARPPSSPR